MNQIQKIREVDFRRSNKSHVNDLSHLRIKLINQINDRGKFPQFKNTLFIQQEESALNLSRQRSEQSAPSIQLEKFSERQHLKFVTGKDDLEPRLRFLPSLLTKPHRLVRTGIPIAHPDGVSLINTKDNNSRGRRISGFGPPTNYAQQFYGTPGYVPSRLHFSSSLPHQYKHTQKSLNFSPEPIIKDVGVNFQDICTLLDELARRIRWHILDLINASNYCKEEGYLKIKLCLTEVVDVTDEIKRLNSALLIQCRGALRKAWANDELTRELEVFTGRSRKVLLTDSIQFKNEYVQYCEYFLSNRLDVLLAEHKRKYRAMFERVLTENYKKNLKIIRQEGMKRSNVEGEETEMIESATQTPADNPETQKSKADVGTKMIESATQTPPKNVASNFEIQAKGKTNNAKAVKSKDLNNIVSSITITQSPKSPNTSAANLHHPTYQIKVPKTVRNDEVKTNISSKHKPTDTVIITPAYPSRAPYKRRFETTMKDLASSFKKGKFSLAKDRNGFQEDGVSVIVIDDDDREDSLGKICIKPKASEIEVNLIDAKRRNDDVKNSMTSMIQLAGKLNHKDGVGKNLEQNVVTKEGPRGSKQVARKSTPTARTVDQAKKVAARASLSNETELRGPGVAARRDTATTTKTDVRKKLGRNDDFDGKGAQVSHSLPEQKNTQKNLLRTSIINFINKNSSRDKCNSSKQQITERVNASGKKQINSAAKQSGDKEISSGHHDNPDDDNKSSHLEANEFIIEVDREGADEEPSRNGGGMGFVHQIQGLEVKHHLTPEEYVGEMEAVDRMDIPTVFKCFYTYVTKQQILQRVNPISFKLFLELFNNGGLQNFYRKYVDYQKRHEI